MAYILKPEDGKYDANCMPMMNCVPQEMVIRNVRLAAAYIPWQNMCELFKPVEALKRGTAFPELYSPFDPKREPWYVWNVSGKKCRESENDWGEV